MRVRRASAEPRRWPAPLHRLSWWLTARGVDHVVIGGAAAACYLPDRVPHDLDVVLSDRPSAAKAAERAITLLLAKVDREVAGEVPPLSAALLADGLEIEVPTSMGRLHIVGASLPDQTDRRALRSERQWFVVRRRPMPVCALEDLVGIKSAIGTAKDLRDVRALHGVKGTGRSSER